MPSLYFTSVIAIHIGIRHPFGMKLLFLAPQPFFQERGTPIAVKLAVEVLTERVQDADRIELLTYHEGQDINIPGVVHHRIKKCGFIRGVSPGISLKKVMCDLMFLFTAIKLAHQSRKDQFDLIHAVEESVFIAMILKFFYRIPYVYDMDSSIAMQLTEKWWWLRPLAPFFSMCEKLAVKYSEAVVPVCDALAAIAQNHGSKHTHILRDVSLMNFNSATQSVHSLRDEIGASPEDILILYVGNLEGYQGVDLLIDSFRRLKENSSAKLVIIGGTEQYLSQYRSKFEPLISSRQLHLLGARPVSTLGQYLKQADILASPRIRGNNTPMKIYSYLHSGKAIIATNLPTHTQVLNSSVSLLVSPNPTEFSAGLEQLICDSDLRRRLGRAGFILAETHYTFDVFKTRLNELYDRLTSRLPISAENCTAK